MQIYNHANYIINRWIYERYKCINERFSLVKTALQLKHRNFSSDIAVENISF